MSDRLVIATTAALVFSALLAPAQAPVPSAAGPRRVITGVVREGRSGAPVAGAVVEARDGRPRDSVRPWDTPAGMVRTTADAQGRFQLGGLGPGGYTLTAVSRGVGRAQRRGVAAGARVDLVLVPSGSASGVVRGPDGAPVAGALVLLESTTGASLPGDGLVVADGQGRFEVAGLEAGRYRVMARHKDLAPAWRTLTVDRQAAVDASLSLGAPLAVTGRLVDSQERPLRGRVAVSEVDGIAPPRALAALLQAESGADGSFRLGPVPAGVVVLSARGVRSGSRRVEVPRVEAGRTRVDVGAVALDGGLAIRGVVQDRRGRPVSNARVTAQGPAESAQAAEDTTGTDGAFVLAGLESDRYRVAVEAPGLGTADREVQAGDENVVFVIQENGKVTGLVVDAAGVPVEGYRILVRPQPSLTGAGSVGARREVEGAAGRFTLALPPATYLLDVIAPDREPASLSNVVVDAGGAVDVGQIRLGAGGIVRGTVVDTTGTVVAGAVVTAAPPRRMRASSESGSDAAGVFELRGVPSGTIRVTARHPAYAEGAVTVEVDPARGATAARVVLSAGGRVQGLVRHRDGSAVAGSVAVLAMTGDTGAFASPLTAPIGPDGSFAVERIPAGRARLVLLLGPVTQLPSGQERDVEVREGQTTTATFDLRDILVAGRVTRAGTPAGGFRITVTDQGPPGMGGIGGVLLIGPSTRAGRGTAVTRDDGSYELVVDKAGSVRVTVEASDGSLRLPARILEIPDVEQHTLDLDFAGLVLAGIVVDAETERPLGHANVVADARRQARDGRPATAVTSADGRFQLAVEPGQYRVSAQAGGYSGATSEVEVAETGASDLRLSLSRGGVLRGRVVDAQGRPAPGGIVRALASVPGASTVAAPILPDGRFELTGLGGEAEHTLVARSDGGGFALRAGVRAGAEEVTLVLRRGGRIQLKLVGPDGKPAVGAYASVFRVGGLPAPGITPSGTSDGRGMAEIASPTGEVEVRVSKVEGATTVASGSASVVVEEGGTASAEVRLTTPAFSRQVSGAAPQ